MQSSQIIAHNAKVLWVISLDRNFKSGNVIRLYLTAQLSSSTVCSWYCDTVLKQRWNMFWYNEIQTIILGRYYLRFLFSEKLCISINSIILLYLATFWLSIWCIHYSDLQDKLWSMWFLFQTNFSALWVIHFYSYFFLEYTITILMFSDISCHTGIHCGYFYAAITAMILPTVFACILNFLLVFLYIFCNVKCIKNRSIFSVGIQKNVKILHSGYSLLLCP